MSEIRQQTILLTLGRLPVALELARTLQAAGLRVIVADPYAWPLARLSRTVSRCYRVAAPADDAAQWRADIASIVAREQVSLVVPVSEEILHAASLPASCAVACMPINKLLTLHDKWRFMHFAQGLGVPVPVTLLADDTASVQRFGVEGFVIKPRLSCSGNGVSLHAGNDWPGGHSPGSDRIVQQRLTGASLCTLTLAHAGRVVHTVAYRSLIDFGSVSVCFERSSLPDVVQDGITAIVSDLQYYGFIGFDIMADSSGDWQFIECNPRATSGVHLFPYDALLAVCSPVWPATGATLDRTDEPANRAEPTTRDVFAIRNDPAIRQEFWSNLSVFYGSLFKGRFDTSHLRLLLRTRDITWRWRDPLPFLLSSIVLLPQLLRGLRQGRPVVQLLTEDIGYYDEGYLAGSRSGSGRSTNHDSCKRDP